MYATYYVYSDDPSDSDYIHEILNEKKSWPVKFDKYDLESEYLPHITIAIVETKFINDITNQMGLIIVDEQKGIFEDVDLSITYNPYIPIILLNKENWLNAHKRIGITRDEYCHYLVYHEVGHALGFSHISDNGVGPVPIMMQVTKGLTEEQKKRFVPYPNETDYNNGNITLL
jgi:predicted Zn-dependent protease with MMP-like domain